MIIPLTLFFVTDNLESRWDVTSFMVTKRASSQLLLLWYANWNGSSESWLNDLSCGSTIRSQVLKATEVNATGLRSFILPTLLFLGTGTMQELYHISGTTPLWNDKLKIVQNISHSWLLHIFKTFGEIPSDPVAFEGLSLLNSLRVCSLVQTKSELLPNAFLFTWSTHLLNSCLLNLL